MTAGATGWIVRVVAARDAGQPPITESELERLVATLDRYQAVVFCQPDTYTVELIVDPSPRDGVADMAVGLVENGLRESRLPIWSVVDVTVSEAEEPPCGEPQGPDRAEGAR